MLNLSANVALFPLCAYPRQRRAVRTKVSPRARHLLAAGEPALLRHGSQTSCPVYLHSSNASNMAITFSIGARDWTLWMALKT